MLEVKLHDIGEGMTEGEILHYYVKPGDRVSSDQPLVEVQTDKMTAELPSPSAGTVKEILVPAGKNVAVGTTLLIIDSGAGEPTIKTVKQPDTRTGGTHTLQTKRETVKAPILAAPYTRKIARELGVQIEQITGTGPGGRITDEDVYTFSQQGSSVAAGSLESVQTGPAAREDRDIPFNGRRKQIAVKMTKSLFTIPHVTHFEEADVTTILELTSELKEKGARVSAAAFFIKAVQLALQEYPVFNSVLDEEQGIIRLKSQYHIGLAVDTEEGLIVPVIREVERKSIMDIHNEMKVLIEKAKSNTLTHGEITGGTFTISNVGPLGSIAATPIINYPETGLLAFHKAKKRPAVVRDEIAIRSMMNMSMSFDHRVADGAQAIAFTNRLVGLIENPANMLLELK